jgi:anti-sigma-K factor RskA
VTRHWPVRPAAVALGLLDDDERPVAERLLREDPAFGAEVERLRGTASALGELELRGWRPVPPPPLDGDRALTERPPERRRRSWRRPALALAPVLAAAALAAVLWARPEGAAPATVIALHGLGGVPGRATVTIRSAEAELRGAGMPPSRPGAYYEAWLVDRRGRSLSMGAFRVGRDGSVDAHMPVGADLRRYRFIDVSLEADDGNPAHSATSVMRARL